MLFINCCLLLIFFQIIIMVANVNIFETQCWSIWNPKQDVSVISELECIISKGDKEANHLFYTFQSRLGPNCSLNGTLINMTPVLLPSVSNSTTYICTIPRQIVKPCTRMAWRKYWLIEFFLWNILDKTTHTNNNRKVTLQVIVQNHPYYWRHQNHGARTVMYQIQQLITAQYRENC